MLGPIVATADHTKYFGTELEVRLKFHVHCELQQTRGGLMLSKKGRTRRRFHGGRF